MVNEAFRNEGPVNTAQRKASRRYEMFNKIETFMNLADIIKN